MTDKGTKTLIGAFVLGAIALFTMIVVLIGSGLLDNKTTTQFVLYFDGNLRGLVHGSPVYFKGVRVGRVAGIQISVDDRDMAFQAPVIIEMDNALITGDEAGDSDSKWDDVSFMQNEKLVDELIRAGLRAKLGTQSYITGQLTVDMDVYHDVEPINPKDLSRYHGLQQIPTLPSSLDAIFSVLAQLPVQEIGEQVQDLLSDLNTQMVMADLPALTTSLTRTSDAIHDEVLAFAEVRKSALSAVQGLDGLVKDSDTAVAQANKAFTDISAMAVSSRATMANAGKLFSEDSTLMLEFGQTMRALREASAAISQLATLLELKPDALIFGRGK